MKRKTSPRVKDGKTQRKNRSSVTPSPYNTPQPYPVIDRERPGRGYKHLIRKSDLDRFVRIVPDWDELARGLDVIVQASGEDNCLGWCDPGIVAICAWERKISWDDCDLDFYEEHQRFFSKIDVPCSRNGKYWSVGFDEKTAKAFQLIHVLVHELGHHHDRMTTRSKKHAARGEGYAEEYAERHEDEILRRYICEFELY